MVRKALSRRLGIFEGHQDPNPSCDFLWKLPLSDSQRERRKRITLYLVYPLHRG
jgi:hypothetical protein